MGIHQSYAQNGMARRKASLPNSFDPDWFAEHAAPLFAEWLRAEYRGDVSLISRLFGVREQTVCYWLSQATTPNGKAMLGAVIAFAPLRQRVEQAYQQHLSRAA